MRWAAAASSSKNNFPALEWAVMWVVRIQQPIPIKKAQISAPFLIVVLFDYIVNDFLSLF
jgi:hypothetical protein